LFVAEGSSKYVEDHRLELLEGVSNWVQQEAKDRVNMIIEFFKNNLIRKKTNKRHDIFIYFNPFTIQIYFILDKP
jgi:hypothetical protein